MKVKEEEISEVDELLAELIERVAGEIGLVIYSMGLEEEFTDEQIANELGVEINEVRKALFALYEIGLASYRRVKDDDTGWIEYFWKLNYDKEKEVLLRELTKTKRNLEEKLKEEDQSVYYLCKNGCVKVSYEEAMEYNFMCPKCGGMLEYLDNTKAVEAIKKELEHLEKLIKLIS
ncbi:Transcription factor TFIIE, alpha subunit [Ferroglobus placidus DSM 10642]|uniref:Transcription factor E n=1 Tax=Ferroglobus placidus (strain DSM 10642 / AEDII12DO) TaxID=589924 RepID=D3S1W9_FERPA|nr:transcription factor E [Ferroglobus placidus]ADC64426.1 Transcription factor TFIIE, alpha subunit [Ferroglobus placidus DSM 10642]